MRSLSLIALLILSLSLPAKGETDSSYTFNSDKSRLVLNVGFMYSGDAQILNLSFDVINHTYNDKLEYGFSCLPNSLVHRDTVDTWRYSFQTPVNLSLLLIRLAIEKAFYPSHTESFTSNPGIIDFIMFAPNSSTKYKFTPEWSLGLKTNTDYFFTRVDGLDRGILFTPALELTYFPDGNRVGRGAYTLSLTHSSFVNFEGDNESDGFGVKLSFYVNALFN